MNEFGKRLRSLRVYRGMSREEFAKLIYSSAETIRRWENGTRFQKIDALHEASTAVFYSKDFNYANVEQARARIHRIGQKYPCTYIDLVARGTIDEKIQEALDKKQDLSAGICDDWRKYFMKEDVS